jgi:electron transfer flavoprotein alpha subunit
MGLNKVWVFGEASEGKVASITLEMLAKAREIADTVEVVYGGADADAVAGTLGEHGASVVHATGDLGGGLPGVAIAAAIAEAVKAGNGP